MAFTAFTGQPAPTRFQTTGKILEKCLLEAIKQQDTRVYPHQIEAVFAVKAKLAENVRENRNDPVLVVAPTGSGKSGMVTLLPYILQCRKVFILTPSQVISNQLGASFGIFNTSESFLEKIGIFPRDAREDFREHGIILTKVTEMHSALPNLVIGTAQTLARNSLSSITKRGKYQIQERAVIKDIVDFFDRFDTLIIDEAHHYPANTWCEIEKKFRASKGKTKNIIFLTATPVTKFEGQLINILPNQRIACAIKRTQLEGKFIRPLQFKLKENENHLYSDIKSILEDEELLDPRFCKPQQRRKPQAMILSRTTNEADKLALNLNASDGSPNFAVSIHGNVDDVRFKIEEFAKRNKYQVAITCGSLLEGFDNEAVTLCVILRRVESKVLFSQFIGRCMKLMKFESEPKDRTIGTVLSYPKYNQKQMFDDRDSLAACDPVETKIEDESFNANIQLCNTLKQQTFRKRSHGTVQNARKRICTR